MKELGTYLKRTRVSNGVNMAEAAEDLELSVTELENIESGNVKAFKDVYDLKEKIRIYAKYLGLDCEKVIDEFNGFLFTHTSKISLEDIKSAQKKSEVSEKKIKSPYTMEHKGKSKVLPIVIIGAILIAIIFIVIYFIVSSINQVPTKVDVLSSYKGEESSYEFTY